jgi:DNA-binding NtrC family response regulator
MNKTRGQKLFPKVNMEVNKNMQEKPSLLIVDDDENMLETLSDLLQEKGYWTETAKTGKEAITKAKEHFFNVALIDIKLPDITGIEVLQTFRKEYPSRMNIIITAYATLQNAVDAVNLGANAYIMKPIDHKKLDQIMKQYLKKQHKALKITQEKLTEFTEEAIAVKWEEREQQWASQNVQTKET